MTAQILRTHAPAASRPFAARLARDLARWAAMGIGAGLVALGVLMTPLPGPLGLPVTLVGLMLLLRNSFRAKRAFVRFQRRHPRIIFPMRRLLRREPEILPVAWQATLRIERLVLPPAWRKARTWRRRYFRRRPNSA